MAKKGGKKKGSKKKGKKSSKPEKPDGPTTPPLDPLAKENLLCLLIDFKSRCETISDQECLTADLEEETEELWTDFLNITISQNNRIRQLLESAEGPPTPDPGTPKKTMNEARTKAPKPGKGDQKRPKREDVPINLEERVKEVEALRARIHSLEDAIQEATRRSVELHEFRDSGALSRLESEATALLAHRISLAESHVAQIERLGLRHDASVRAIEAGATRSKGACGEAAARRCLEKMNDKETNVHANNQRLRRLFDRTNRENAWLVSVVDDLEAAIIAGAAREDLPPEELARPDQEEEFSPTIADDPILVSVLPMPRLQTSILSVVSSVSSRASSAISMHSSGKRSSVAIPTSRQSSAAQKPFYLPSLLPRLPVPTPTLAPNTTPRPRIQTPIPLPSDVPRALRAGTPVSSAMVRAVLVEEAKLGVKEAQRFGFSLCCEDDYARRALIPSARIGRSIVFLAADILDTFSASRKKD
ncbi:hypothetical protein M427DRAFT_29756 [Gonapodya prolifera JEL478]|uniref:Uncharacterized protein n=1 Tax=Gonapodya prolifera (strain JEL478) TaxID=1344416 RepID=A0A139ANV0_GONPJ|nr:hypothetical protein M427DRAFT_29756 [Gonapodya prolifera JEL478]|eukprot:KXS18437.1 hypothetical protein M427DRAFT_29756 [Gonapodya prolifera JEL478]